MRALASVVLVHNPDNIKINSRILIAYFTASKKSQNLPAGSQPIWKRVRQLNDRIPTNMMLYNPWTSVRIHIRTGNAIKADGCVV
jgi:hypothetical protein